VTALGDPDHPGEPAISDYGLIGDMRTAALIDRHGRIDWLCWPRFDSPPLLRRLIDPDHGGSWLLAPALPFRAVRRYLPDTNVIETKFSCQTGTAVAFDFMAVPASPPGRSRVVRIVRALTGTVPVHICLRPTRGFDLTAASVHEHDGALVVGDGHHAPVLTSSHRLDVAGEEITGCVEVGQEQPLVMMLGAEPRRGTLTDEALRALDQTVAEWRRWLGRCALPQIRRKAVARSALTLKLLHHEPTSALVAAPTTSLPETLGGQRNWDYRYTWLRDAAMMLLALQRLGQHDEAMAFWGWLADIARRHGEDLSVAYTLDGSPLPFEQELEQLAGYRRSRPVRIGNAAGDQRQHDVFGHVLAAAAHCYRHMNMDLADLAPVLCRLADLAARRWSRPDDSIWELRSGRAHHTYSRLLCWQALDCAIGLTDDGVMEGDARRWRAEREAIQREVHSRAWNGQLGAFAATIGGQRLDASVLAAAPVGFVAPHDSRFRATRETISRRLSDNGFIHRYRYEDGITDPEQGAFLLCTLWLADAYTLDGEATRGEELLDRVLGTANDLGLLAEEVDPVSGQPLGNFPQGLTHLGVIDTAIRLAEAP
jgi:alpha,alpha-trehalase